MERKPDTAEPSIFLVCAWRENCVKKYSFTGQHCLEYTRDLTLKAKPVGEVPGKEKKWSVVSKGRAASAKEWRPQAAR